MRMLLSALALALALPAAGGAQDSWTVETIETPAPPGAHEPALFATGPGQLILLWTDEASDGPAVRMSTLDQGAWSPPVTVAASPDLFVNWADFPSVARFADGTLLAHWLQRSGRSAYAYDVALALSHDDGASWSAPATPHRDGTPSQHGFVTLLPFEERVIAVWLDGRAYDGDLLEPGAVEGAMQLRTTTIASDGTIGPDVAIDLATCSCCQTAAAVAGGALLVVYRDRTEDEIRDISIVRMQDGAWSKPAPIHADGWEISGCPVNGPSIAANGDHAVVAWFTGAQDTPAIKIAFSPDAGQTFDAAVRVDLGRPVGRVDTILLDDGSALVSWVEWEGRSEHLLVCRATREGCLTTQVVATNASGGSVNFPQMAATPDGIVLAWTQPLADGRDSVAMVRLTR